LEKLGTEFVNTTPHLRSSGSKSDFRVHVGCGGERRLDSEKRLINFAGRKKRHSSSFQEKGVSGISARKVEWGIFVSSGGATLVVGSASLRTGSFREPKGRNRSPKPSQGPARELSFPSFSGRPHQGKSECFSSVCGGLLSAPPTPSSLPLIFRFRLRCYSKKRFFEKKLGAVDYLSSRMNRVRAGCAKRV